MKNAFFFVVLLLCSFSLSAQNNKAVYDYAAQILNQKVAGIPFKALDPMFARVANEAQLLEYQKLRGERVLKSYIVKFEYSDGTESREQYARRMLRQYSSIYQNYPAESLERILFRFVEEGTADPEILWEYFSLKN